MIHFFIEPEIDPFIVLQLSLHFFNFLLGQFQVLHSSFVGASLMAEGGLQVGNLLSLKIKHCVAMEQFNVQIPVLSEYS